MNVAIIGAGFTGLAAGYYLGKKGHKVTIFEKDAYPGGLAVGYQEKNWDWSIEHHYHHWFTNDKSVLNLAAEINHTVEIKRPKTSSFVDDEIFQLDSPISLLKFPKISLLNRLRMGISLSLLRYNPVWLPLEKFRAIDYLKLTMGKDGYKKIWEPLMINKLGEYSANVSLAWFWARVYKRTPSLAYPEGGFLKFAQHLQKVIEEQGGKFYYNTEVAELISNDKPEIKIASPNKIGINHKFDSIIVTLPSFLFAKIAPQLPASYTNRLKDLKGIGAMNLILRLKKPFLPDNTYWLNMCDRNSPILAIVEHTNFMDKKHYNNENIVYLGNYMPTNDPRFKMDSEELLKLYDPWLSKINPGYKKILIDAKVFKAPFAQPIITPNYSKRIPKILTPITNVFLANIEQVYPWDRGTNYAVALGKKVTERI